MYKRKSLWRTMWLYREAQCDMPNFVLTGQINFTFTAEAMYIAGSCQNVSIHSEV